MLRTSSSCEYGIALLSQPGSCVFAREFLYPSNVPIWFFQLLSCFTTQEGVRCGGLSLGSLPPLCLWYREVHGDSELTSLEMRIVKVSGTRVQISKTHSVLICWFTVTIEKAVQCVQDFGVLLEGWWWSCIFGHFRVLRLYSNCVIQLTFSTHGNLKKVSVVYPLQT